MADHHYNIYVDSLIFQSNDKLCFTTLSQTCMKSFVMIAALDLYTLFKLCAFKLAISQSGTSRLRQKLRTSEFQDFTKK